MENNNYKSYGLHNLESMPFFSRLTAEDAADIRVVARVLPFKTNNYVVENLIDWDNYKTDPIYNINFPQRGMLTGDNFNLVKSALEKSMPEKEFAALILKIRLGLNPDPAQQQNDVPVIDGERINGLQHKYDQTVLFFPAQGQTCHEYCTFCFRWPQFCGMTDLKFSNNDVRSLIDYIRRHERVTNVLFTGGDPMTMTTKLLAQYIKPLLEAKLPNLNAIRIGTKSLVSWPRRYTGDPDAGELMDLFKYVIDSGVHLAVVAHINHPVELSTEVVREAVAKVNRTGAVIRAQSPLLKHINAEPGILEKLWRDQVNLGIIPYYLFIPRDTSAQVYFGITLEEAYDIFSEAYKRVSGLAKTVRGPVMSTYYGKVQLLGANIINDRKYFCLLLIHSSKGDNVNIPFFAEYDSRAAWFKELKPAFGKADFFPPTLV